MTRSVLLVDDEMDLLRNMRRILEAAGCRCLCRSDARQALSVYASESPDVVITDMVMPRMNGMQLLGELRRLDPDGTVIVLTAYGTVPDAVQAIRGGAFDYLEKPFHSEVLELVVERALEHRALAMENRGLRHRLAEQLRSGRIIGSSPGYRQVLAQVELVAAAQATALLTGETGAGKGVLARALHDASPRCAGPFVPVDCTALPEALMESELFGHCRGAYTGAEQDRKGLVETADGGTLFLDEVGDLPLSLQSKLLRLLEDRTFRRLGESTLRHSDARVIAATHRNLEAAVREGSFRQDLYYRIAVVTVEIPPLRQRPEDVLLLAVHFLGQHAGPGDGERRSFTPDVLAALTAYAWPGNVRELRNAIERAVVLAPGGRIEVEHLPPQLRSGSPVDPRADGGTPPPVAAAGTLPAYEQARSSAVQSFEEDYLRRLLQVSDGNVSRAARLSGMDRRTIHRMMKRLELPRHLD